VRSTSPIAVWETVVAISRILSMPMKEAQEAVIDYLDLVEIDLVSLPPHTATIALHAFDRFGKGRHPAQLNMGDCFAYACARHFGQPLLFKGGDFPLTDIEAG
jgi:ribonuclease VapC